MEEYRLDCLSIGLLLKGPMSARKAHYDALFF